jgi:hypothetical protein
VPYHFFPLSGTVRKIPRSCLSRRWIEARIEGIVGMGAIEQLASASLAALFSIGMLIASHAFMDYRSSRNPTVSVLQPIREFTVSARRSIGQGFDSQGFDSQSFGGRFAGFDGVL